MELLRSELHKVTRLLHSVDFLQIHCNAISKLLVNINTRYLATATTPESKQSNNRFYETFSNNPDLCFALLESLSRIKLFINLYIRPIGINDKYDVLRQCWVFLNSKSLSKALCLHIRHFYSLVKNSMGRTNKKSFEDDYRSIISRPVSRRKLVMNFDEICPKLNSYKAINNAVVKSLHAFFYGLNEMLKARRGGCSTKHILKIPQEDGITNTNSLVGAIELEMLAALRIKPTKEIDIVECMQRYKKEGLGRMVFETQPLSLGSNANQNKTDFDIYEVIQEIALLSGGNANSLLIPTKYTYTDGFCFVYRNIKIALSSVLCDNKRHALYDFTSIEALCIIKSVGSALMQLQDLGFVHNAINADNVYFCVSRTAQGERETVVKVSNFIVNQLGTVEWQSEAYKKTDLQRLERVIFTAPEVLLDKENVRSNDIYSAGMLLWQLVHFKKDPLSALLRSVRKKKGLQDNSISFGSNNMLTQIPRKIMIKRVRKEIVSGFRPKISKLPLTVARKQLCAFVEAMWDPSVTNRPSAKELVDKANNLLNVFMPNGYTEKSVVNAINENLRNGENIELKGLSTEKGINPINKAEESYNDSTISVKTDITPFSRTSKHVKSPRAKSKLLRNYTLKSKTSINSRTSKTIKLKRRRSRFNPKRVTSVFGQMRFGTANGSKKNFIDQIERDDDDDDKTYADQEEADRALFNEIAQDFDDTATLASNDNRLGVDQDQDLNTSFKLL